MRKYLYCLIVLLAIFQLTACKVNQNSGNEVTSNEEVTKEPSSDTLSNNNVVKATEIPNDTDNNKKLIVETVNKFIKSIANKNQNDFIDLMNADGIFVIRNFVSGGYGDRGKDIKNTYTSDNIPVDLQFTVSDELPIIPADLFAESLEKDFTIEDIQAVDDTQLTTATNETATSDILNMISDTLKNSNNQEYSVSIIQLGEYGFMLSEAQLIDGTPVGTFAIFEKTNNKFYLKAIIDLR